MAAPKAKSLRRKPTRMGIIAGISTDAMIGTEVTDKCVYVSVESIVAYIGSGVEYISLGVAE